MNKVGLLASHYGWSINHIMDELDGAEGWIWYNFAVEHENRLHGGQEIRIVGKGYIQQEIALLKTKSNG